MQRFSVGDVVVVVRFYSRPDLEGSECTITGPLQHRIAWRCGELAFLMAYATDLSVEDGGVFIAEPDQIRLKKPPREDLQVVRWDQCPWQPETIQA